MTHDQTRICVPLTHSTCEQMAAGIDAAAAAGADMIELRLDCLADWTTDSIRGLMQKADRFPGQVIATCRHAREEGHWDGDESARVSLMELVGLNGADYIDFEYEAWRASANIRQKIGLVCDVNTDSTRPRCRLILSKHDFQQTPDDPTAVLEQIAREPCHVVKLACKANTVTDALRMLDAMRTSAKLRPTIAISMGEPGIMTRVLAGKFGALLTFASLEAGKESAPGQITIEQMHSLYRWGSIRPTTQVYGVIACPVGHSMSPAIHNAAFDEIGYDGIYLPFRVEPDMASFEAFVDGCISRDWLHVRGYSVTIPHKENLLRYADRRGGTIEPLAKRIGVANTLAIDADGRLSVYNTDCRGALDALCAGMGISEGRLKDLPVTVIGAGGAGRAIVAGLCDRGSRVTIYNLIPPEAAESLAAEFGAVAGRWEERGCLPSAVIINCTSLGMWPKVKDMPLPADRLKPGQVVFDVVYNPIETRLLSEARKAGCRTIDGVTMFVNQAVAQFERWTSRPAPVQRMREVVVRRLSQ